MSTQETQSLFPTAADLPLGKRPVPERYLQDALTWLRANCPAFFTEDGVREFYLESVTELCAAIGDAGPLRERLTAEPEPGMPLAETSAPQLQLLALANHGYARDRCERGRRATFPGFWLHAATKLSYRFWLPSTV